MRIRLTSDMMKVMGNRVLVRPIRVEFSGRFVLPEKTRMDYFLNQPRFYEVVAVGPGRKTRRGVVVPIELAPGERVICVSDTEGEEDAPNGLKLVGADTVLAAFPPGSTLRNHGV